MFHEWGFRNATKPTGTHRESVLQTFVKRRVFSVSGGLQTFANRPGCAGEWGFTHLGKPTGTHPASGAKRSGFAGLVCMVALPYIPTHRRYGRSGMVCTPLCTLMRPGSVGLGLLETFLTIPHSPRQWREAPRLPWFWSPHLQPKPAFPVRPQPWPPLRWAREARFTYPNPLIEILGWLYFLSCTVRNTAFRP